MMNNNLFVNKKGVVQIITISLLLLMSVSTYGYFNGWYKTFISDYNTKFNDVSARDIKLKYLDGDTLYVQSLNQYTFNYSDIKIAGKLCGISGELKGNSVNMINVGQCIVDMDLGAKEIIIISDKGIFVNTLMLKSINFGTFYLQFETSNICPDLTYTKLFALEKPDNSHAQIPSEMSYTYSVCLKNSLFTLGNSCTDNHIILFYIGNITQSHVWINNSNPYKPVSTWQPVCVSSNSGTISKSISSTNPNDGSVCVGSILQDDLYGGLLGDCAAHPDKIWVNIVQ